MLGDAQLAKMRADVARMLPGTAIIQAVSNVSDGSGGFTETWAAVTGGTVACRVDPIRRGVQIEQIAAQEAMEIEYQLTLPYNAPVLQGRRAVIGGTTYEIRSIDEDKSWAVSKRARIVRAG